MNAAYLWAQLEVADDIYANRMKTWNTYMDQLKCLVTKELINVPYIPEYCNHNANMFYIKTKNAEERTALLGFLENAGINAVFHYIPLHSAPAGRKYGRFHGVDNYTTRESERIVRLPLYYGIKDADCYYVCEKIKEFYR